MDLTSMTEQQLHDLQNQIAEEWDRRRAIPEVEKAKIEVLDQIKETNPELAPDTTTIDSWTETGTDAPAWKDPGTIHAKMYRYGEVVSHNGETWVSEHPYLNHWEPGAPGIDSRIWKKITPPTPDTGEEDGTVTEEEVKPFVQPTGSHDTYKIGDRVLWEDGAVWESVIDNNSWSPTAHPVGWKKI